MSKIVGACHPQMPRIRALGILCSHDRLTWPEVAASSFEGDVRCLYALKAVEVLGSPIISFMVFHEISCIILEFVGLLELVMPLWS